MPDRPLSQEPDTTPTMTHADAREMPLIENGNALPGVVLYVMGGASRDRKSMERRVPLLTREDSEQESAHLARVVQSVDEAVAAGGTHLLVPREAAAWLGDHPLVADYFSEYHDMAEANAETGIVFTLRPLERTTADSFVTKSDWLERHEAMAKKRTRETLDEIGIRNGTDKASTGHGYLPHYETFLSSLRDQSFDMLEIGIYQGASIRMWHEYFPKARIIGVDTGDVALETRLDRFVFHQGNQGDLLFLNQLADTFRFKVIVDDGSHLWGHQIFSFETLFPSLQPGGIYVCEDVHTSCSQLAVEYAGGASESALKYFLRLTEAVAGWEWADLTEWQDPRLFSIRQRVAKVTIIPHAVVVQAR